MENLLFSDVPQNDAKVMKSMKVTRIVLIIFCAIGLLFAVLGLILKDIVIVVDSVIGIVLFFPLFITFITCLCMEQQYLLVFTDKIKYKKGLLGKEKQLTIAPSQYKIKLRRLTNRSGYTVWLLFYNQKGKRVLSYKLCQPLTGKRKYDLSHIGCKIVDRQQVLQKVN